jgi:hypothetical protein
MRQVGHTIVTDSGHIIESFALGNGRMRLRVDNVDRDCTETESIRLAQVFRRVSDGGPGDIVELTGFPPIEVRNEGERIILRVQWDS